MFLKILQTSPKNTCVGVFWMNFQSFNLQVFYKETPAEVFSCDISKIIRASILKNICQRLLLEVFYKKAVLKDFTIFTGRKWLVISVLWKNLSICWHNVVASYPKTPVFESLFNSEYCKMFKSTYFEEHLQTAASENLFIKIINKEN